MNSRQMVRAMRQFGITVLKDKKSGLWWAGDAECGSTYQLGSRMEVMLQVSYGGSQHYGKNPEVAVEDYCNARGLEWDY